MDQAQSSDDKIKCKLHVQVLLNSSHEGISLQIDDKTENLKLTCQNASSEWKTEKPIEIDFSLPKRTSKAKGEKRVFSSVKFQVRTNDPNDPPVVKVLEPEFKWGIIEFVLFYSQETEEFYCYPVLPATLLIQAASRENLSFRDSNPKTTKNPEFDRANKWLRTIYNLRLDTTKGCLQTFDGTAISFKVTYNKIDREYTIDGLKATSFDLFRHYIIFYVEIDLANQCHMAGPFYSIPARLNMQIQLKETLGENEKLFMYINWQHNRRPESAIDLTTKFKDTRLCYLILQDLALRTIRNEELQIEFQIREYCLCNRDEQTWIQDKSDKNLLSIDSNSAKSLVEKLDKRRNSGWELYVCYNLDSSQYSDKLTCSENGYTFRPRDGKLLDNKNVQLTVLSQKKFSKKSLLLTTGIEPGIMTYNVRIDGLDGEPTVEPYLPTYQLPREQILHYFHSLLQKAGLKAGLNDYSYEDVKNKYARRLVPQVRLDGGYDMRYLASRPYDLHDIWGKDGENPFNNPPDRIEVSAIEHCSELGLRPENAEKTTKLIRQEVCSRLHTMYKWREKQVFDLLGKIFDKFPYEARVKGKNYELYENNVVVTDEKYYFKVVAGLGMLLKQSELRDDFASYLMKNAAAVVRGRLEAFLVSPEYSRLTSKHFGAFRSHLNAAGVWFVFLMGLWCRNGGTEDFEEKIKETNTSLPESTTKLHIGDTSLHLDLSSVELKMNLMPRDGILWYFYSLLNGRFSAVVTEKYRKFDVLKKTYAKPLVPKITIGNRYDKRFTASKPIRYFDIWNSTEEQEGHPIAMPISRCALEFEDPKEAFDCLKNVFEGREQKVFTVVRVSAQAIDDKIIEGMNKFVESQDKNSSTLKELAQNAAAIVRGRCESLLVHPDLTSHDEQSEGKWKTEIRTIGLWFSFLMVVCSQKKVTQKDYSEVIRDPKLPQQVEFKAGEIPKDYLTDLLKRTINSIQGLAKKSGAKGVLSDNLPVFIPTFKHNANKTISRYAENSTAGKSYEFHDIWGTGGVESGSQKITKCSLEFPKRGEAYEQLRERFRSRSKLIFRILFEKCQVPVLRIATLENGEWRWSDETKETFYQHLTHSEAVPSLQVKSVKFTEPVFKLLLQNAAAIVRGRVESLLVNPGLQNNQEPNFNANWETEIDLICAWFQFLVLVWCARPKGHNLKHFRSDITEPRSQPHGRYTSEQYEQYVNAVFTAVFNAVIEND